MTSHDLCIIHLSDLHFANGIYRSVFDNLINDIRRQVREDEDIAILVTGDLVSQGAIAPNKDELGKFFEGLAAALPVSSHLHALEIVPGNHDGQRKLIKDSNGIQHFDLDLCEFEDVVKIVRQHFEGTCHLPVRPCAHMTTAIDFYGRHIVFCMLNTSFFEQPIRAREIIEEELKKSGTYEAEKVNRLFTQYKEDLRQKIDAQCRDICKQCQDDRAAHGRCAPDLTIITAHHPLSVLNISGYEQAEDALFKRNLEFGDLWISGHVHFSQHYFTSDNTKQRIMLTTGIGWQDSQRELLRYSIYRVNLDRNTCQVSHRFSTSNDDFKPDGTTGTNEEFSLYKHFTLPLRLNSVGATIHANSSSEVHARGFYVDVSAVEMLPRMLSEMREARRHLCKLIDSCGDEVRGCYKNGLSGGFWHRIFTVRREERPIPLAKIRKRLHKKRTFVCLADSICKEFACVLQRIALLKLVEDKKGSVDDAGVIEWRVHWRRYQGCRGKNYCKGERCLRCSESIWIGWK